MSVLLRAVLAGAFLTACGAMPAAAAELHVEVRGIPAAAGRIMVALYDGPKAFAAGRRTAGIVLPARDGAVTAVFQNVPAGRYGVAVLHDLDGDGELDRTVFGMPAEPFGFSNDAIGFMGPPEFDAMAFDVTDPATEITLTLRQ